MIYHELLAVANSEEEAGSYYRGQRDFTVDLIYKVGEPNNAAVTVLMNVCDSTFDVAAACPDAAGFTLKRRGESGPFTMHDYRTNLKRAKASIAPKPTPTKRILHLRTD